MGDRVDLWSCPATTLLISPNELICLPSWTCPSHSFISWLLPSLDGLGDIIVPGFAHNTFKRSYSVFITLLRIHMLPQDFVFSTEKKYVSKYELLQLPSLPFLVIYKGLQCGEASSSPKLNLAPGS